MGRSALNLFVRKLGHGARLDVEEASLLSSLSTPVRHVERGRDILSEGGEPRSIVLVLEGWAGGFKQLENGKRQIISVYVPGDLNEPFGANASMLDHSLSALTPVVVAHVTPASLRAAAERNANIGRALWWDLLMADAILRERIVSLGRRSATERLGHFFCELHLRLRMVGLADEPSYEMPLTQADLADLLGVSDVHLNRSLQELRRTGLLSLRGRRVTIHDVDGLREVAMFDPVYLDRTVAA